MTDHTGRGNWSKLNMTWLRQESRWGELVAGIGTVLCFSMIWWNPLKTPDVWVTNWSEDGEIVALQSRSVVGAVFFLASALILLVFGTLSRVKKGRPATTRTLNYYNWGILVAELGIWALYAFVLLYNIGFRGNIFSVVALSIGGIALYVSIVLRNIEPGWFLEIRNRWTLRDGATWRRTHRLAHILVLLAAGWSVIALVWPLLGLAGTVCLLVSAGPICYIYSFVSAHTIRKGSAST